MVRSGNPRLGGSSASSDSQSHLKSQTTLTVRIRITSRQKDRTIEQQCRTRVIHSVVNSHPRLGPLGAGRLRGIKVPSLVKGLIRVGLAYRPAIVTVAGRASVGTVE